MLNFEVLEVDELGGIAASEGFGVYTLVGAEIGSYRYGERDDVGFGHGDNPPAVSGSYIPDDCPSEKMGRYREMRMKTTTTPMTIRMAGSMSASAAASAE